MKLIPVDVVTDVVVVVVVVVVVSSSSKFMLTLKRVVTN